MKKLIIITYDTGSSVTIEVPERYYQDKYKKKPEKKLHQIFVKEYKNLVKALNKGLNVVDVNNYLEFSQASVSGKNILSVDVKDVVEEVSTPVDVQTFVPGVHDQVFLNIDQTAMAQVFKQIQDENLIENLSELLAKVNSYFSKSNVEFTIKAGKKPTSRASSTTTRRKKKTDEVPVETAIPEVAVDTPTVPTEAN